MITMRSLKFMSPDEGGSGGGSAAVQDPPAKPELSPAQKFHGHMRDAGHPVPDGTLAKDMPPPVKESPKPDEKGGKIDPKPDDKKGEKGEKAGDGADGKPAKEAEKEAKRSPLDLIAEDAKPAKAVEQDDTYDDLPEELPDDKKQKGINWARARAGLAKLSETRTRVSELENQLKMTKEAPPEAVAENARLKEELARYKDAMVEVNIELDPDYRSKFVAGRETKVDKASVKVANAGGNGDAMKEALGMKEGKARTMAIKEAIAEVDPIDQARIMALVTEIENLDEEAADMRANSQKSWEKRKQEMATEAETKKAATELNKKTIFEKVGQGLADLLWPLRKVDAAAEGSEEWNGEADKIHEKAWSLTQAGVAPEEYAKAAWAYGVVDRFQTLLVDAYKTIKTQQATISEYETAAPGYRGGGEQKAQEQLTPAQKYHIAKAKLDGGED